MIISDIWHKYHKWYFILLYIISWAVRRVKFETILQISWVVFLLNIMYKSCYYLFIPLPARGLKFSHFKLSWNTIALSRVSPRILVAGERCNFTGEYCERGSMSEHKIVIGYHTLNGEFCVVNREFSDLRWLINTLSKAMKLQKFLM